MTYKNGIKEYSLTTVLFGAPMGVLFGFFSLSFIVGIIAGILSGLLFSFFTFLFVKVQEKNFDKKRMEIAKERKVICDGVATINGNGGWLFLTEDGLEFYPHKINISTEEIKIPAYMIKSVKTHKNKIVVSKINNSAISILVSHNKEWKNQIEATIFEGSQQ